MRRRCWPIARTGPDPEHTGTTSDALPLAGNDYVWFDHVRVGTRARGWRTLCATELETEDLNRLSDRRETVCGISLERPRIMGIVNVTPDSFSDGGDRLSVNDALVAMRDMADACSIMDVGGESTRPGAETVPATEEIARVVPVIRAARGEGIDVPISVDTRKATVAEAALDAGADFVNDVSALTFDPALAAVVAERGVPICLMHARGEPATMQDAPHYEDILLDTFEFLEQRIEVAEAAGIPRKRIIIDPGIGFGKTLQHNLTVLQGLSIYHDLGVPLLLGVSRKRTIGVVGRAASAKDRLPGSLAAALHGAGQGVHMLRVHDANETRQALDVHIAMNTGEWNGG